jgi:predicted HTH domain antitoxin
MALIITDDTLSKAQLSADELIIDLACYLYDKKRLSMGQARHSAGLDQISFQKELAKRDIYIHYTEKDLEKDLKNLGIELG